MAVELCARNIRKRRPPSPHDRRATPKKRSRTHNVEHCWKGFSPGSPALVHLKSSIRISFPSSAFQPGNCLEKRFIRTFVTCPSMAIVRFEIESATTGACRRVLYPSFGTSAPQNNLGRASARPACPNAQNVKAAPVAVLGARYFHARRPGTESLASEIGRARAFAHTACRQPRETFDKSSFEDLNF